MGLISFFTIPRLLFLRDYVLPLLVLSVVTLVPPLIVAYLFIIGGQAHFAMAYLYQYRGKKMGKMYALTAFVLLIAALVYLSISGAFTPVLLAVSLLFALHFAIDEFTLHGEKWGIVPTFTTIGFFALFSSIVFYMLSPAFHTTALAVAALVVVGVALRFCFVSKPSSAAERYLWYISALLILISFVTPVVAIQSATAYIIWLHYLNWLIGYGIKVHGTKRARQYWVETAVTYVVSFLLFCLYFVFPHSVLQYFFAFLYYYLWAIAHILLSFITAIPGLRPVRVG